MSSDNFKSDKKILQRVKEAYGFHTDLALAEFLGVSQPTVANWKKRDSIDLKLIITKCEELNQNWLLNGEGPVFKKELSLLNEDQLEYQYRSTYSEANALIAELTRRLGGLDVPMQVRNDIFLILSEAANKALGKVEEHLEIPEKKNNDS